jgi:hypothetical protein
MITPERSGLLKSFLGGLPEQIAARLAQAVEVDRLVDGRTLPHEMILEGLRPALRRATGADRTPTPLRAFCVPFEDLFTLLPRSAKQKGRIARTSVAPVWNWLNQVLLPEETRNYAADFRACILAGKQGDARDRAAAFWPLAAKAMQDRLGSSAGVKAVRNIFGSDLILADAAEMALLLNVGDDVVDIQKALPKPVPTLTDELLWPLRTIYDRLISKAPDAVPYVAVITMHRLAKPWEALKLPLSISRQTQDTLISHTDMGLVGEIIFGDIETYSRALLGTRHPNFDDAAMLDNLARFTTLSSGIVKGIDMRRDGKWGQRLLKDRAALAEVMDGFMERAAKELANALPMQKGGFVSGSKVPDFSRPVDADRIERAQRYARLVAGCKPLAVAASFGASAKQAEEDMRNLLRTYNEDVVRELRNAAAPARREIVESQFALVCGLTATLFGDEEAELLRRRGKAALQATVAA